MVYIKFGTRLALSVFTRNILTEPHFLHSWTKKNPCQIQPFRGAYKLLAAFSILIDFCWYSTATIVCHMVIKIKEMKFSSICVVEKEPCWWGIAFEMLLVHLWIVLIWGIVLEMRTPPYIHSHFRLISHEHAKNSLYFQKYVVFLQHRCFKTYFTTSQ